MLSILATGTGGGITINTSQKLSYETFFRTELNVLAKSGPITMTGNYDGLGVGNGYWYEAAYSYWGSKAGVTGLTTSSSNISIVVDNVDWQTSLAPAFATTGTLEVKPTSTSFSRGMYSSWFPMNQNGQTVSGFTFGKLGNTAGLTIDAAVTVNGPITLYGGDITVNANLTSSAANAQVLAKASGAITFASGVDVTTQGGNQVFWSDSDANGAGAILSTNTTGNYGVFTTNGGDIVMAGG